MKSLIAFLKKEWMEQLRTGRLLFLGILFLLFGIMNPAVAKMTPWLFEMMADTLAESGVSVTTVTVSAMDSWVQFFKNMPIGLIVFVLLESSIFTKEYQSGTLVLSLTKGLDRYQVVVSKTVMLIALWTAGYWLCFGITYAYSEYFWDNSVAQSLWFAATCWWVFGLWVVMLMVLFSTLVQSNTMVLVGTGGIVLALNLLGLFPKVEKYLPTLLSDGNALIYGNAEASSYAAAFLITLLISVACVAISFPIFNKKQL